MTVTFRPAVSPFGRFAKKNDPAIQRFYRHASPEDRAHNSCWLWNGYVGENGYGYIGDGGSVRLAHRWAYEWFRGPIPDGLHIDHLCRTRRCVNPYHLEAVTQAENNRRAWSARSRKTHCPQGHVRSQANDMTDSSGQYKGCRVCQAMRRSAARSHKFQQTGETQ